MATQARKAATGAVRATVTLGGLEGMAEGGTIGATAALANAAADAMAPLGIKVTELPLSPERIAEPVAGAAGGRSGC